MFLRIGNGFNSMVAAFSDEFDVSLGETSSALRNVSKGYNKPLDDLQSRS